MKSLMPLFLVTALVASFAGAEGLSDQEILRRADLATGGGIPGISWKIDIVSTDSSGETAEQTMEVKATEDKWVAETVSPKRSRGQKLLKIGQNMWFTKRGLRKPVPISLRQRLSGGASNGDVASTQYATDYNATRLADETLGEKETYVFILTAKHNAVTYDRIKYWIDKSSGVGVKAEFYSKTEKLLKTATFEHENTVDHEGRQFPFISEMWIEDEITGSKSHFVYSDVVAHTFPPSTFRL
jgi:hypothetical protein